MQEAGFLSQGGRFEGWLDREGREEGREEAVFVLCSEKRWVEGGRENGEG